MGMGEITPYHKWRGPVYQVLFQKFISYVTGPQVFRHSRREGDLEGWVSRVKVFKNSPRTLSVIQDTAPRRIPPSVAPYLPLVHDRSL